MHNISIIMGISFLINSVLSSIKIIIGFILNSGSLLADGIHSLSDLITDVIAILGNFISKKPADDKHPYGHGRLEYLTSLVIGVIILILGFTIISNAWYKELVIPSIMVATVCIFTIICKLILSLFLINRGKALKNNILISSGKESSTDVLSSIVVLISSVLIQFSNKYSILKYADLVATIIVGIFIVRVGFMIIKENISILIGECEDDKEVLNTLNEVILTFKDVRKVDKLTLLKYGSYYKLICEVSIDGKLSFYEAHNVVHKIEETIKKDNEKIKYITIHANPYINEVVK